MKSVKQIFIVSIAFILGGIIFGSVGIVVAENIQSSIVDYNKNSQATVEDALDDLYSKADRCVMVPQVGDNLALAIKNSYLEDG